MRFSKSATIIAALAIATTGTLALSQHDAKAATVATVTATNMARLYTSEGTLITNRALAPNSAWLVGKTISINGNKLYQVSTDEYLKANDSQLSDNQATSQKIVGTLNGIVSEFVYNDQASDINGKIIIPGTSWVIGKHIINKYGQDYVQLSPHEYILSRNMSFSSPLPAPTYVPNFDVLGKGAYDPEEDNSIDNNTNNNNTDNKPANDYKPDLNKINDYFVKYLNALHAANGTQPVQSSADMISYATQRAGQQDGQNLDHSTATRSTSENLSSAGYEYMLNYGDVHSDKDAAYFLLKDWYDEEGNATYGHRAALIYSGPTVGLGITDGDAAFDADWNYSTLNSQNAMYSSTSEPNTKFVSKDAVQ
ncbi:CAP domain-containing protein [Companilactobacillus kimchiensis]|uniref:Cell surface protein n=1 Tax=Companilactobacillus kimchiensis TaxID=993692 RepID=A0A0R2LE61_9LACO|nr:CAP domain-containing protein [Companilactobacillus kimchiensis]KRO00121.1 cell surface protein [Companilactobacillus kimchiensis]